MGQREPEKTGLTPRNCPEKIPSWIPSWTGENRKKLEFLNRTRPEIFGWIGKNRPEPVNRVPIPDTDDYADNYTDDGLLMYSTDESLGRLIQKAAVVDKQNRCFSKN